MKTIILTIISVLLLSASIQANEASDDLKRSFFWEKLQDETVKPEQRLRWWDSLINISPKERYSILIDKAEWISYHGKEKEAREIFESLKPASKKFPLDVRLKWMANYARCLSNQQENFASLALIDELKRTPMPDSLRYWDLRADIILISIHNHFSDTVTTSRIIKEVEQKLSKLELRGDKKQEIETRLRGIKAFLYLHEGNLDMAYIELKKALQSSDSNLKANALFSLAELYRQKGEFAMAENYMQDFFKLSHDERLNKTALILLSWCKFQQKDYKTALDILNEYPTEEMNDNFLCNLRIYYALKAQIYQNLGNYPKAFESYESALEIADSIQTEVATLQQRNAEQFLESNRRMSKAEHNSDVMFWILIIVAGAWALQSLSQIVIIMRNKVLRRKVRENREGARSAREAIELLEREQEAATLYQEQSERRHSTSLMKLSHLQSLMERVSEVLASDDSQTDKLSAIKSIMLESNVKENMWELFQVQLEQTNHNFIANLTRKHPDLSKAELRMCVYILLNMTNKDIAELIGRSMRTVGTTKHNLRKRMRLTPDQSTEEYLRQFV